MSSGLSVLLVEDNEDNRRMYADYLGTLGFRVLEADNLADALHGLEHWTPDVVVLDLLLPRLGGRDVLLELQSRHETRGIPLVIVTGTEARDVKTTELVRVLHKPIAVDALVQIVDDAMRSIRERTEPT